MSVSTVTEHWEGSTGQGRGTVSALGTANYTAKYIVQTSDASDQVDTIFKHFKNTSSLPYYGRSFIYANDQNSDLLCVGIGATKRDTSRFIWDVEAEYESRALNNWPAGETTKGSAGLGDEYLPLAIECGSTQISIPVEQAVYHTGMQSRSHSIRREMNKNGPVQVGVNKIGFQAGGPVCNSAFVNFDPALEMEIDIDIVRVTASYLSWQGETWRNWRGMVNSQDVRLVHIGLHFFDAWEKTKVRVHSINGNPERSTKGRLYWRVTVEFWNNPLSWRDFIVDRGLVRLADVGSYNARGGTYATTDYQNAQGRHEDIIGPESQTAITEPVLLDGFGQPLKPGNAAVYIEYQKYEETDLNPLMRDIGRR